MLVHTPGDPAGIGPELLIRLAQEPAAQSRIAVCSAELLRDTARTLGLPLPDGLKILDIPLDAPVKPGQPNPANATYVLDCLRRAAALAGRPGSALITGPVHKASINAAGIAFSGHTEFLAELTGAALPVMMLVAGRLRVALVTTHLPLSAVPAAITAQRVGDCLRILDRDLRQRFSIGAPRLQVCGLNPHAGEGGYLGREDIDQIAPAIRSAQAEGVDARGPVPADTVFTPQALNDCDAVLAMYHDQGLPVLKHAGFGAAVNVTLGLPIIRTSVDHGTAFELVGSGRAEIGSLRSAEALAQSLIDA